jgi:hypothetical protein
MSSRDGRRDRGDSPRRGSAYNDYYRAPEQQPRPLAHTDPLTGELVWVPDWARVATGWQPFDQFMRDRGVW